MILHHKNHKKIFFSSLLFLITFVPHHKILFLAIIVISSNLVVTHKKMQGIPLFSCIHANPVFVVWAEVWQQDVLGAKCVDSGFYPRFDNLLSSCLPPSVELTLATVGIIFNFIVSNRHGSNYLLPPLASFVPPSVKNHHSSFFLFISRHRWHLPIDCYVATFLIIWVVVSE